MSKESGKILIVDDDEDVLLAACMLLKKQFSHVQRLKEPAKLTNFLQNEKYDAVLLDMNFHSDTTSGREGLFYLKQILELSPQTAVVMFTAFGDIELAVEAIKNGAFDFVLKPWENCKLISTISAALKFSRSGKGNNEKGLLQNANDLQHEFIGAGRAMRQVFSTIAKVAPTDANVLITGENGTGKELVARALHSQSKRVGGAFVPVDMGAITESLFESELFGHVKGAFTDAQTDRTGRFGMANNGTLFLDEIGNLPLPMQAKLLTILQNRQVTKVGSNIPVPINIRLICATNLNLYEMVKQNSFRQDLLYRINTVEIKLPPLREREEDIMLLADYFLQLYENKYYKKFKGFNRESVAAMKKYTWPGNIRELQHTIERAVILNEGEQIEMQDILQSHSQLAKPGFFVPPNISLEEVEKTHIIAVMKKHDGNISRSARELGLTRTALYRRLEKYGI